MFKVYLGAEYCFDTSFGTDAQTILLKISHFEECQHVFLHIHLVSSFGLQQPYYRTLIFGSADCLTSVNHMFCVFLSDINPQVNFYWKRGQRIIPKGHRRGRVEQTRFQIDDHPHSQIRITQQLPQVEIIYSYLLKTQHTQKYLKANHCPSLNNTNHLNSLRYFLKCYKP